MYEKAEKKLITEWPCWGQGPRVCARARQGYQTTSPALRPSSTAVCTHVAHRGQVYCAMMNAYSNINDPPSPQAGPPEVPAFPADDLLPPQPEPAPGPTAHQSSKAAALIDGSETVLGVSAAAFHPLQPLWQLRGRGGRTRAQTDGGWNELVTKGEVRCLAASADGSALLTGSSNVRLWEARTGANTHTVMMKPRTTTKCAASQPPRLPPPPNVAPSVTSAPSRAAAGGPWRATAVPFL
jgi:hypothetical protein